MLIVRRSKLYYTASGIITLKQVSGPIGSRPVHIKKLQISMHVPFSQIFINITDRYLDNMATCFDPHLDHLKANIIHK